MRELPGSVRPLWGYVELASFLGIGRRTAKRWVAERLLPARPPIAGYRSVAAGDDRALGHPAERGAAVERGWSLTCTGVRALLGRGSTPEPTGPTLSHDSATSMSDTISMKRRARL